jgi:C4-dicarboxylate-specific signal transduction histidine kinase
MADALRNIAVAASPDWLEQALDIGGIGAWAITLSSGEMVVTETARAIFGGDPAAPFTRADFLAAIHPDDREAAAWVLENGTGHDGVFRICDAEGERRIELCARTVGDGGRPLRVTGVVLDVTDCQRQSQKLESLRAELLQVARLNDLGAMASALAHELNQPLAAASNYLAAADRFIEGDPGQAHNAIAKAEAQFVRTKEIIQRIRGFVGQAGNERKAEDAEIVCREVLDLARVSARYDGASLFLDVASGLPPVDIDKVQIQQVLLNLLRNAVEAMTATSGRRVTIHAEADGEFVRFTVADNGPGLTPAIAEHLFQPFHTTKEGGMGVGLSLCRKIVESQGGRLWHEAANPGARFCFTVPVAN